MTTVTETADEHRAYTPTAEEVAALRAGLRSLDHDLLCECDARHEGSSLEPECDEPAAWWVTYTYVCECGEQNDTLLAVCERCLQVWRKNGDPAFTLFGPVRPGGRSGSLEETNQP